MYEHLFRHVFFPLYEGPIKQRGTHRFLASYEKDQWLSRAQIEAVQLQRLNALLDHCWRNVPFLAQHWGGAGVQQKALESVRELEAFPVLTKQLITAHFGDMRARNVAGPVHSKSTSGSTGEPFRFEYTQESYARRTAIMWRGYRWCGTDLGRRTAYLWGSVPPSSRVRALKERWYHAAFNRLFLDSYGLTEANVEQFIGALNQFKPRVIVGFIAPLSLLSRYALERGIALHRPDAIIGAAEALTGAERELIQKAFGAPTFDSYGCREFMLIACECAQRKGLHVNADHLVVETVDAAGRGVQQGSGDLCITDLFNYAMPLVRYLNGDRATSTDRVCECGRGLPLLESIDGRVLDIIRSPDGRTVPGEFFVSIMLDQPGVVRYQIIQDAIDAVEVRIVPHPEMTQAAREGLLRRVGDRMGPSVRVWLNEVDDIPLTSAGKRRVTVSRLPQIHGGAA